MSATEYVVLVDEQDRTIGTAEKLAAHKQNLLHRAFSIFVFRKKDNPELLLQQRALHKYHSPGLWTNTCCSHPRENEDIFSAADRRLKEELGFQTSLENCGWFKYQASFSNGLSEHEIDHVLLGEITDDTTILPNSEEVHAYRWITPLELKNELLLHPQQFTPWLAQALDLALQRLSVIQQMSVMHCRR